MCFTHARWCSLQRMRRGSSDDGAEGCCSIAVSRSLHRRSWRSAPRRRSGRRLLEERPGTSMSGSARGDGDVDDDMSIGVGGDGVPGQPSPAAAGPAGGPGQSQRFFAHGLPIRSGGAAARGRFDQAGVGLVASPVSAIDTVLGRPRRSPGRRPMSAIRRRRRGRRRCRR